MQDQHIGALHCEQVAMLGRNEWCLHVTIGKGAITVC